MGHENPEASNVSIGVIEVDPWHSESQRESEESEIELSGPIPVMTTDLFMGDHIWTERSGRLRGVNDMDCFSWDLGVQFSLVADRVGCSH